MAWTHRTPQTGSGTGTTVTVTAPGSLASGDVIYVWIVTDSGDNITTPDGTWTERVDANLAGIATHLYCATKTAGGSEPGSYDFGIPSGDYAWVSGAAAGGNGSVDVFGGSNPSAGSTTYSTAAGTPGANGALVIGAFASNDIGDRRPISADTSPAATMVGTGYNAGEFEHMAVQRYEQATAASVSLDFTLNAASGVDVLTIAMALLPAAGGPTPPYVSVTVA